MNYLGGQPPDDGNEYLGRLLFLHLKQQISDYLMSLLSIFVSSEIIRKDFHQHFIKECF